MFFDERNTESLGPNMYTTHFRSQRILRQPAGLCVKSAMHRQAKVGASTGNHLWFIRFIAHCPALDSNAPHAHLLQKGADFLTSDLVSDPTSQ